MKTFHLENLVSYRINKGFYSDYLNIFSTSDYAINLFVLASPMEHIASLNIGEHLYSVYSEDGEILKIDTQRTMEQNKYKNDNDPNLDFTDYNNSVLVKITEKKETIMGRICAVYLIAHILWLKTI